MTRLKKIIIIVLMICSITVIPVMADSGWDNDYSSSSSSDWGSSSSDWGSSSSWDHSSSYGSSRDDDYDYDYDYGLFHKMMFIFLAYFILTSILYKVVGLVRTSIKNKKALKMSNSTIKSNISSRFKLFNNFDLGDIDSEIKKYYPELDERSLIELLYKKIVDVQEAWMNFDYDSLKRLCSDELYTSYKSDLEVLKLSNGKNVMNDFSLLSANIESIREENDFIIIKVYMYMSFIDFVFNTKLKNITKGDVRYPVFSGYDLEFIVSKKPKSVICPGCGAELKPGVKECSYCHTVINSTYGDFVLNVKKKR